MRYCKELDTFPPYYRVSTNAEKQLCSYEKKATYYEDYIKKRLDLGYAGIYANKGITAINTKDHARFNLGDG